MIFSNVLRIAGRTSVKVLSNLFGVKGELYYPKGYKSGKSGYDDEIEYGDKPDWEGQFLAPFVYATSKQYFGGFYDELNGDEKAIYFDDQMIVPINSLVVFNFEGGNQLYRVIDLQANNDDFGPIYTKAIVTPVTKSNEHTKTTREKAIDYAKELVDLQIDADNSTDEFINDLLGKGLADLSGESDIEKTANEKIEIEKTNKKVSNDTIFSISDEDLL